MACGKKMEKISGYYTKVVVEKQRAIVLNINSTRGMYYSVAGSKIECMKLPGCPGVFMHFLWMEKLFNFRVSS